MYSRVATRLVLVSKTYIVSEVYIYIDAYVLLPAYISLYRTHANVIQNNNNT